MKNVNKIVDTNMYVRTIFYLVIFVFIMDTINGALIYNGYAHVGIVYKLLIFFLMLVYLLLKQNITITYFIIISTILLSVKFFVQMYDLTIEITWIVKFLLFVVSYCFFRLLINDNFKYIHLFFKISTIVICFNLLGSLLGFGYSSYGGEIGTKGYIYAGNELGAVIVSLVTYWAIFFIHKKNISLYMLFSIISLFFASQTAMKTSIFGTVIILIVIPIIYTYQHANNFKIPSKVFWLQVFLFLSLSIILPIVFIYVYYNLGLGVRIEYYIDKVDFISLILSNRNVWAYELLNYNIEHLDLFYLFFGYSYEICIEIAGNRSEIDIIDIYMALGLLGVFITYGFWLSILLKSLLIKTQFAPYITFSIALLLFISMLSGHIINSGLSAIIMGALFSLMFLKKTDKFFNKNL